MEIIRGLHNIRPRHAGCVATVGNFDGVHHGHQMLLAHLRAKSDELGAPSLLATFEPQPREFLRAGPVPARLTRFREKTHLLAAAGIDRVLCIPFNARTQAMPAKDVVERFLVRLLAVRYLVVGDDFRFGNNREGDYAMLKKAGDRFGFGVSHMGTLTFEHERVSSTRVREALAAGDLALAAKLLGRRYFLMGRVVGGQGLGRRLGVPTMNIPLRRAHTALGGVFAVVVEGLGPTRRGVANIGLRPTVTDPDNRGDGADDVEPLLEVHLFDYHGDAYGKPLTVTPIVKLREERWFPSLAAMKTEIDRDIAKAKALFGQRDGAAAP